MILGTGVDIIEVNRVGEKLARGNGFRELVFAPEEIAYCEKQAHPEEHFAARFAAKEAFFKALGTGWRNGTAFHEIVVEHNENGQPQMRLTGQTAETLSGSGIGRIHLSLSHVAATAVAIVILEKQ